MTGRPVSIIGLDSIGVIEWGAPYIETPGSAIVGGGPSVLLVPQVSQRGATLPVCPEGGQQVLHASPLPHRNSEHPLKRPDDPDREVPEQPHMTAIRPANAVRYISFFMFKLPLTVLAKLFRNQPPDFGCKSVQHKIECASQWRGFFATSKNIFGSSRIVVYISKHLFIEKHRRKVWICLRRL